MNENKQREKFSSGLAVFFATLSSTIGLGNIVKFPAAVFILLFYSNIAGWVYLYTFKAIRGDFTGLTGSKELLYCTIV